MTRYLLRRTAFGFLVVAIVFTTVFVLLNYFGDPAVTTLGPNASPEQILEFWGSPAHIEKLRAVQVEKCPRCTYGIYARQIENTLERDAMCLNFP